MLTDVETLVSRRAFSSGLYAYKCRNPFSSGPQCWHLQVLSNFKMLKRLPYQWSLSSSTSSGFILKDVTMLAQILVSLSACLQMSEPHHEWWFLTLTPSSGFMLTDVETPTQTAVSHLAFSSRFHAYKYHNPVLKVVSKLRRLQVVSCSQMLKGCLKQWSLTWLPSCDFIPRLQWSLASQPSSGFISHWNSSSCLSPAVVQRFHARWSFQCAVTMLSLLTLSFSVVTLVVKRSDYNSCHVL